jgi:hypothetical protein
MFLLHDVINRQVVLFPWILVDPDSQKLNSEFVAQATATVEQLLKNIEVDWCTIRHLLVINVSADVKFKKRQNFSAKLTAWRNVLIQKHEIEKIEQSIIVDVEQSKTLQMLSKSVIVVIERCEELKPSQKGYLCSIQTVGHVQIKHFAEKRAVSSEYMFDVIRKALFHKHCSLIFVASP